uniref:Uncharacterized protein n=1 Tax=Arundo donax TaxID=35708 RepID=A0A0A9DGM8_ARUDO
MSQPQTAQPVELGEADATPTAIWAAAPPPPPSRRSHGYVGLKIGLSLGLFFLILVAGACIWCHHRAVPMGLPVTLAEVTRSPPPGAVAVQLPEVMGPPAGQAPPPGAVAEHLPEAMSPPAGRAPAGAVAEQLPEAMSPPASPPLDLLEGAGDHVERFERWEQARSVSTPRRQASSAASLHPRSCRRQSEQRRRLACNGCRCSWRGSEICLHRRRAAAG